MAGQEKVCIELVFTKGPSTSRRTKAKDFWKFLDAQRDIFPYKPPKGQANLGTTNSACNPEPDLDLQLPQRRIWFDELRIFHQLGLDRTALAADNTCKQCLVEARINDREPELADSVPQPYEELIADVKAFGKRTKHQGSVCAYNVPDKYEHLIP